jgi:hypothetical protein
MGNLASFPIFESGQASQQPPKVEREESFGPTCHSRRLGMWMRRHPESRASADHASGPIKAKAAPSVANSEWTTAFPSPNTRSETSNAAAPAPAILVRYPVNIAMLASVNKAI